METGLPVERIISYLALGDSYTIGTGVQPGERWPVQVANRLDHLGVQAPHILAQNGWTSADLANALELAEFRPPYGLVTVLIGVNDQYRGLPRDGYHRRLDTLLARAVGLAGNEPGRVVVVSIPDWSVTPFATGRDREQIAAEIEAFNAVKQARAHTAGTRYVDITPLSRELSRAAEYLAQDGLHPSGRQYARWAAVIEPVVAEALQSRR